MKLLRAFSCCLLMNVSLFGMGRSPQKTSQQASQSRLSSPPSPFAGSGAAPINFAYYFILWLSQRLARPGQNQ